MSIQFWPPKAAISAIWRQSPASISMAMNFDRWVEVAEQVGKKEQAE